MPGRDVLGQDNIWLCAFATHNRLLKPKAHLAYLQFPGFNHTCQIDTAGRLIVVFICLSGIYGRGTNPACCQFILPNIGFPDPELFVAAACFW